MRSVTKHESAEKHAPVVDLDRNALMLQESQIIGDRIKWYLDQHEKIETLGLFSTGAVWAFVLAHSWSAAIMYVTWIPVFITFFLAMKSILFTKTINEAFQYLYEMEEEYGLPKDRGWVHYFRNRSSKYKRKWRTAFWVILLAVNILVPSFFPFKDVLH